MRGFILTLPASSTRKHSYLFVSDCVLQKLPVGFMLLHSPCRSTAAVHGMALDVGYALVSLD